MNGPERIMFAEKVSDPVATLVLIVALLTTFFVEYKGYRKLANWMSYTIIVGVIGYLYLRYEFIMAAYRP